MSDIQEIQPGQPLTRRLPERIETKCSECGSRLIIGPSPSMQMGSNSGHATCPHCKTFLHVQLGECETTTERWQKWMARMVNRNAPGGDA